MTDRKDISDLLLDEAAEWLLHMQAHSVDPVVAEEFKVWHAASDENRAAFQRVERAWHISAALPTAADNGAVPLPITGYTRKRSPKRFAFAVGIAALAASLMLAFFPTLQRALQADYTTATAELRRVTLADGSTIDLGPGSAIAVRYTAGMREIEMFGGEAFFDVEKNPARPFVVYASGIKTIVTGTSFAVRDDANAGEVEVALRTGAVEVVLADGAYETLAPGDRITALFKSGNVARDHTQPDEIGAWRDNRLTVHNATLARVVSTLGRYHRGIILFSDAALGQRRVTGSFDLADPADALRAAVGAQKGHVTTVTPYMLVIGALK